MSQRTPSAAADEWAGGPTDPVNARPDSSRSRHELAHERTGEPRPATSFLFRIFFLYFAIQALPLDGRFVRNLLTEENSFTRYFFNLSRFAPRFLGPEDTFVNWGIVLLIAVVGGVIWSKFDSTPTRQDGQQAVLSYWLRVLLRYRLALAVLAYGFIKLFPLQAPAPSLSNLNTAYGDHTAWKLFSLSLGIVPAYESFLGAVELLGGFLLLHRKTATIGTLVLLPFLGNIFVSNLAYEGGEYVYSGLLTTFGLVLFGYDATRLVQLVSLERPVAPGSVRPLLSKRWQRTGRLILKGAFVVVAVLVYGISTYGAYRHGPLRFPDRPGLPGLAGLYTVSEFRLGGQSIPYSRNHPFRWQDVVFETWNTVSIKSNRPVSLYNMPTETLTREEYELAGSQGRHYFRYTADPAGNHLTLTNANPNHRNEILSLTIARTGAGQITLSGIDEKQDSVFVVLDKVNKKYLIDEAAKAGRRGSLTL